MSNPRPTHIASLLFDKRVFTPGQARAWAHAHGFKYGTVELGGPASRYVHLPQREGGRVKRVVSFGSRYSGIRAIVARNPNSRSHAEPRFMSKAQLGELYNLFHLAKVALSGTDASPYKRMLWASKEFGKKYPNIGATAAYKELDSARSYWFGRS